LLIEHPKRTSWNIVGKNKPEEETRSSYRFRVAPGDKQYEEFLVTEERKLSETAMLADLSNQKIDFYLERASFSDEIASALTQLQDMRYELTDLNRQKEEVSSRIDEIFRDQSRIRNNLDHLDEQSNLYKQYVRTLTSQEEQLMDLREQRIAIEERIRRKQKEIREYVEGLNIE
jgi:chromosome segregation ATPase